MKQRIWELDAFRGFCILWMIFLHTIVKLNTYAGIVFPCYDFLYLINHYGGAFFVLVSGICATLGSRSVRRGLVVLACGLMITAVTVFLVRTGVNERKSIIQFGVLHLIGICMLLYPLLKKLPVPVRLMVGATIVIIGYMIKGIRIENDYLFILGLKGLHFASADYFPLMPHLGWFMLGTVIGDTAYADGMTRLPNVRTDRLSIRILSWFGRYSLPIYLIQHPLTFFLAKLAAR